MHLFGIDPEEDRLRIRALRAHPPSGAFRAPRRKVFAAALGQFDELLVAAANVSPASRPLPLYYALNQAGRAIAAAHQPPGRPWEPRLHGLTIRDPGRSSLGDTIISPQKTSDDRPGSFDVLAEAINAPRLTADTTLSDVWGAIPGLDVPGLARNCPRALPLEFDSSSPAPVFAWLKQIRPEFPPNEDGAAMLVAHLKEAYPQASEGLTIETIGQDGPLTKAELAWKSPDGTWRTIDTAGTRYLSATSLWLIPALSSGDSLPPLLLWWCLLQALSSLARYHPAEWTGVLDPDRSREAVSIEKALSIGLAVVPRLVLLAIAPGWIEML